jgi:hypothetical protein
MPTRKDVNSAPAFDNESDVSQAKAMAPHLQATAVSEPCPFEAINQRRAASEDPEALRRARSL